jgi:hypothetical protein
MDRTNMSDKDSTRTPRSTPDSGNRGQNDPTKPTNESAQPRPGNNQGQMGANQSQRPTAPQSGSPSSMSGGMVEQATDTVNQVVGNVQQEATRRMTDQIHFTQEGLGSTAHAIRSASQELRSNDQAMFADVIDRAAEQIDGVANYLRDKDLDQLVGDAENFARRQPVIFVAGATMLGILAGRFLKSSSPRSPRSQSSNQAEGYRGARLRALPGGGAGTQPGTQPMYPQFGAQRPPGSSMMPGSNLPDRGPEAGTGTNPGPTRQ